MTPVTGQKLNLYRYNSIAMTDNLIACARTCTFSVEVDAMETTNISSAWFRESRPDVASWSIQADGLVVLDDYSYLFMLNSQLNRELVSLKFVIDNGTAGGLVIVSGLAWLQSFTITGANKDIATYQVSYQGTGVYSLAGTTVTPTGIVIQGTTTQVLQYTAGGGETSIAIPGGAGKTMIYGSRGGTSFETIAYSGLPGTGVVWTVGSGTLTVDSNVPFFAGEKIIILVQ
jgi:predicted secreted protein